jgi:putative Holliday junction resolvase
VGLDVGRRRIGIAVSDASQTLARPYSVLHTTALRDAVARVVAELERLAADEDGVAAVVVGLPRRLDGTPNDMTEPVEQFAAQLRQQVPVPVLLQDERLTSVEAESRLAVREKDWRARKQKLDAAAAAIILQDYLDSRPHT